MANEEKNPFSYGMKFGDWTVIERAANIGKETAYACECKCGKISNINKISLTKGRSRSCIKCAKAKTRIVRYSVDDFVGDWKILKINETDGTTSYDCLCKCGKARTVQADTFKRGNSLGCSSCGANKSRVNLMYKRASSKREQFQFVGVRPNHKRFIAKIAHCYIGSFKTAKEAAEAYDIEARKRYGEEAVLNFPDHSEGDL